MWDVLKWGWSVVIPHNWYLHKKMDKMQEKNTKDQEEMVRREEFTNTINSVRTEIREGNQQITSRLDSLLNTMIKK